MTERELSELITSAMVAARAIGRGSCDFDAAKDAREKLYFAVQDALTAQRLELAEAKADIAETWAELESHGFVVTREITLAAAVHRGLWHYCSLYEDTLKSAALEARHD